MPIEVLHSTDPDAIRRFQEALTEVGRIRLGRYNPEGRGKPEKLDTMRFTSRHQNLIEAVAELYGGQPQQWTPQGSGQRQWEVYTDAVEIPVYVPRQSIDPNYEAWTPGTCVRRCNGVFETIKQVPCPCHNGQIADRDKCKPTVRIQFLLPEVPGIGTWRLESHGENACARLATYAPLVAKVPMPVPALFFLDPQQRRVWNQEKGKFDTLRFVVPSLRIDAVTAQQLALGGDALTQALAAAGGLTALATAPVRALEAAPEPERALPAADPAPATQEVPVNVEIGDDERHRILVAIENADLAKLDAIREALKGRNIRDKRVQDAWVSKRAALVAAAEIGGSAAGPDSKPPLTAGNREHQQALRDGIDRARAADVTPEPTVEDAAAVLGEVFDAQLVDEPPAWDGPEFGDAGFADEGVTTPATIFDATEQYSLVTTLAGPRGWSTAEVNAKVRAFCKVEKTSQATGEQLHAMAEAMKRGEL